MSGKVGALGLAAGVLLLAGCHKAEAPTIHDSMTEVMEPQAQAIWDIASRAYNDIGDGLVASKLSPGDWTELGTAAGVIRDRARALADAEALTVKKPGEQILGEQAAGQKGMMGPQWEAASSAQVQARIEKDRPLFNKKANELADAMDELIRAAASKDIGTVYKVVSNIDENCDGCHEPFWGTDETPPPPPNMK